LAHLSADQEFEGPTKDAVKLPKPIKHSKAPRQTIKLSEHTGNQEKPKKRRADTSNKRNKSGLKEASVKVEQIVSQMLSEAPTSASTINVTKKRVGADEPSMMEGVLPENDRRSRSKRRNLSKAKDQIMKDDDESVAKKASKKRKIQGNFIFII
jgi:hypothetical protein